MVSKIFKIKAILKNPAIIIKNLFLRKYEWRDDHSANAMKKKLYESYDEYIEHQKSKLETVKDTRLPEYDLNYREALRKRLAEHGVVKPYMNVLCLAARIGTEVKSFLDLGCFAVGIDLNPGDDNKYVLHGDFHDIQFSDGSVDIIFCNSLDHAFDINKLIKEIKRVIKPTGFVVLEIVKGQAEGGSAGYYESLSWQRVDDILDLFTEAEFSLLQRSRFDYPWEGEHVVLSMKGR